MHLAPSWAKYDGSEISLLKAYLNDGFSNLDGSAVQSLSGPDVGAFEATFGDPRLRSTSLKPLDSAKKFDVRTPACASEREPGSEPVVRAAAIFGSLSLTQAKQNQLVTAHTGLDEPLFRPATPPPPPFTPANRVDATSTSRKKRKRPVEKTRSVKLSVAASTASAVDRNKRPARQPVSDTFFRDLLAQAVLPSKRPRKLPDFEKKPPPPPPRSEEEM